MDTKDIEKFDPTVAELTKMLKATKDITEIDLENKEQVAIVKEGRIKLKKARVQIEKKGKELREEALAFQKAVISKEKELIAIIEPEEKRLASIEQEAEHKALMKERLEKLPQRKARLAEIKHAYPIEDEALLAMDATEFEACFNSCVAYSNNKQAEIDEAARVAKQAEIDHENELIKKEQEAREQDLKDREEKVEKERLALEHEKEIEAAKKETEERLKREAEDREAEQHAKDEAEKAKRERATKYREFRTSLGWREDISSDFYEQVSSTEVVLYKKVGVFKL